VTSTNKDVNIKTVSESGIATDHNANYPLLQTPQPRGPSCCRTFASSEATKERTSDYNAVSPVADIKPFVSHRATNQKPAFGTCPPGHPTFVHAGGTESEEVTSRNIKNVSQNGTAAGHNAVSSPANIDSSIISPPLPQEHRKSYQNGRAPDHNANFCPANQIDQSQAAALKTSEEDEARSRDQHHVTNIENIEATTSSESEEEDIEDLFSECNFEEKESDVTFCPPFSLWSPPCTPLLGDLRWHLGDPR
jgi:hypothetical protein